MYLITFYWLCMSRRGHIKCWKTYWCLWMSTFINYFMGLTVLYIPGCWNMVWFMIWSGYTLRYCTNSYNMIFWWLWALHLGLRFFQPLICLTVYLLYSCWGHRKIWSISFGVLLWFVCPSSSVRIYGVGVSSFGCFI